MFLTIIGLFIIFCLFFILLNISDILNYIKDGCMHNYVNYTDKNREWDLLVKCTKCDKIKAMDYDIWA